MSVQYYPNGIGGTVGDSLDTCKPLQTSGNVWYVSSLIGTDAASPAGQNREKPLATLAQAVTNAVDDDIIVLLQGHTQTLVATQAIAKSVTLIGEGTTAGKPAVSFLMNAAATPMFNPTVNAVEFRNLYFPPNLQANTGSKISFGAGATDCLIKGCYFEQGATDTGAAVSLSGTRPRIESSTFISVAISTSAQPLMAIKTTGVLVGVTLKDVVVSGGTVGFSNYAAIDFSAAGLVLMRVENLNLLLGADANFGTATGRANVQLSTGGSRVAWS